ncbi:MAG: prenyltransferase [Chloroflexi bacterium]|nr:prenyltransferase [Chloroflexota bacterium]
MPFGSQDARISSPPFIGWRFRIWVQSFRLKFLPQGVLPVVLGSIVAWKQTDKFDLGLFFLAFVGAACVQIGLTMLNDTYDYIYGADRSTTKDKNPYSGGSGVLADDYLQPSETLTAVVLFYLTAAAIGAYLTFIVGIGIFWMALFGLFLSVFYTLKPFRFAYHGVGELAMLIGYGPTITLGAAYVQTGAFSLEAGLSGLVAGMLMWSMILVNEIPDYTEDLKANKLNLTVRLGPEKARWLYIASLSSVFVYIVSGVVLKFFPAWALLALISLPFVFYSFRVVYDHYQNPEVLAAANRAMVTTYSSAMLLFSFAILLSKVL